MILLDTNVVSEMMARSPNPSVMAWLKQQETFDLHVSTITIAEIVYGIQALPKGKRRADLAGRFSGFVEHGFAHRVIPFDFDAAHHYGDIMAARRNLGRPMSVPDGQIAAIALSRGMSVATRNTKDFERLGLELIDPFS